MTATSDGCRMNWLSAWRYYAHHWWSWHRHVYRHKRGPVEEGYFGCPVCEYETHCRLVQINNKIQEAISISSEVMSEHFLKLLSDLDLVIQGYELEDS